jgi:hypothetical protein
VKLANLKLEAFECDVCKLTGDESLFAPEGYVFDLGRMDFNLLPWKMAARVGEVKPVSQLHICGRGCAEKLLDMWLYRDGSERWLEINKRQAIDAGIWKPTGAHGHA